jgi:uncharacterized protein (DUF488 family)
MPRPGNAVHLQGIPFGDVFGSMSERTLYTVGHSTRPFSELTALLASAGITLLVDVRAVPRSRFYPQYNRSFLEKNLPVRYRWMGDRLGGKNAALIPPEEFSAGIDELVELLGRETVAVLCSERMPTPTKSRPEGCHRWYAITPAVIGRGVRVIHL